jgi:hypothetical protein
VVFTGVAFVCDSSSSAATQAGLSAQANAIASAIATDDQTMSSLGEQYLTEQNAVVANRAKAAQTMRTIVAIDHHIGGARIAAEHAAIDAYINAGSSNELGLVIGNSPNNIATGQEYLGVAQHEFSTTITTLVNDEKSLVGTELIEREDQDAEQRALSKTVSDRTAVLSSMADERSLLGTVNGQLAELVAAQQAARERAAEEAAASLEAAQGASASVGAGPPAVSGVATIGTSPIPAGSTALALAGIRNCESSDNYSDDTGNGYYGAYQFSLSTWEGLGGQGLPSQAAPQVQDTLAFKLYQQDGFSPWSACSAILGLS